MYERVMNVLRSRSARLLTSLPPPPRTPDVVNDDAVVDDDGTPADAAADGGFSLGYLTAPVCALFHTFKKKEKVAVK